MQRKNVQTPWFVSMIHTLQQKNDRTNKVNDNTKIKANIPLIKIECVCNVSVYSLILID